VGDFLQLDAMESRLVVKVPGDWKQAAPPFGTHDGGLVANRAAKRSGIVSFAR